jgi:hypothetical protein
VLILAWLVAGAAFANLVGWDIRGWCEHFHTVMGVTGSNSISNTVSLTPGGAGVNKRSTSPR